MEFYYTGYRGTDGEVSFSGYLNVMCQPGLHALTHTLTQAKDQRQPVLRDICSNISFFFRSSMENIHNNTKMHKRHLKMNTEKPDIAKA